MWCPDCHTTFCWNTGRIETGMVHNPHYYEWLRQNGGIDNNGGRRVHGDYECGGLPVIHKINALIIADKKYSKLVNMFRLLAHIQRVEINRYHVGNGAENNEDLRISYMLNEIDETHFAFQLQKREKEKEKKREYYQIFQMVFNAGAEYMRQIDNLIENCFVTDPGAVNGGYYRARSMKMVAQPQWEEIDTILQTLKNLQSYANTNFALTGKRYKCKYPAIKNDWSEIETR